MQKPRRAAIALLALLFSPAVLSAGEPEVVHNSGDGLWTKDTSRHLKLIPDLSIGVEDGDENLIFGNIMAIATDSRLNIYVLDFGMTHVQMYDSAGTYVRTIGSEGEGPGHFFSPLTLAVDPSDRIWVASIGRMSCWNSEGKYVEEFRHGLLGFVRSAAVTRDGDVFLSSLDMIDHQVIHKYGPNHELLVSFCDSYAAGSDVDPRLEQMAGGGSITIGPDNRIYYTQNYPYEIRVFSTAGTLITTIRRENDFKVAPELRALEGGAINLRMGSMAGAILMIGDDMFINTVFVPVRDGTSSETVMDLYDLDGRLLLTRRFERPIALRCVDHLGKVYASDREEFPRIVRYRISTGS